MTADDLDAFCALLWDPDVRRFLCDDLVLPRDTIAGFIADGLAGASRGLGYWVLEPRAVATSAGALLPGIVGLKPAGGALDGYEATRGGIEVTIALAPSFWGRGIAAEALAALARHARDRCGLDRLVAATDEPNVRSRRMLERAGYVEVGRGPGPAHLNIFYAQRLHA
jgi:RimJ/RimL family protein N-acetyltransferase